MKSARPDLWWFLLCRSLFIAAPAVLLPGVAPPWVALSLSGALLVFWIIDAQVSAVCWDSDKLQLRKGRWVRWELSWDEVAAVQLEEFKGSRAVHVTDIRGRTRVLLGFSIYSLTPSHQRELLAVLKGQLR